MAPITTVLLAYLLGCVNTGFYLVRARTGADLRTTGSGTLGARNTGRALGRSGFTLALIGDALKGVAAVALALLMAPAVAPAAAVAVVAGHVLPVQLGFRGGKGLATMLGATATLSPLVACAGVAVTGLALAVGGRAGPASLGGVLSAPAAALLWEGPGGMTAGVAAMAAVVLARHATPVASRLAPRSGEEGA